MSIIKDLENLMEHYQKQGVDIDPIDKLIEQIYEGDTDNGNANCQFLVRGVCPQVIGEECRGYDELDCCVIKKAGLWFCGEIHEFVTQDECHNCNKDQDCGCCEYVREGSAIFNCSVCGRTKLEVEVGTYCIEPGRSEEEIAELIAEINSNPGNYFNC